MSPIDILYWVTAFLGFAVLAAYIALVLLTPPTMDLDASERVYLSPKSPNTSPLPNLTDSATLDLSIVIPAFNESTRLPLMLKDTLNHLIASSSPKRSCEILIVDDGSRDNTTQVALSYEFPKQVECRVIKLARNRGKGGAVKSGVMGSRGRRILMVDADGASRFEDLEGLWTELDKLLESAKTEEGVAVGSRAHLVGTEAVVKRSALRNFLMHSFHIALRTLGVGHIRDTQCGFKLFTRPAAVKLFPPLHLSSWLFDVELLLLAQHQNIPVVEVPVGWHEVEGSKLNVMMDSVGMLKDLLVLRGNYLIGRWKIDR